MGLGPQRRQNVLRRLSIVECREAAVFNPSMSAWNASSLVIEVRKLALS